MLEREEKTFQRNRPGVSAAQSFASTAAAAAVDRHWGERGRVELLLNVRRCCRYFWEK